MAIDELPEAPDPANDTPQDFSAKAAASVLAQRKLPGQINAAIAEIGSMIGAIGVIAAGGAFAIPYVFDTTTTDADPGAGKLRLSSATQNAATVMRLDLTSGGQDYTTLIDTFDDSTSAVKGAIRLVKQGDITKWMTFNLTALATPSGYRNLTVVCTDSSAASPFSNGDALMLQFQRTGDKGQDAVGALQFLGAATVSSAVAQINFLSLFSAAYDKYVIEVQGIVPAAAAILRMRLAVAGAIDSSNLYNSMSGGGSSNIPAATTLEMYGQSASAGTFTIEVRNANAPGLTSIGARGVYLVSGLLTAVVQEGAYRGAAPVTGFSLYFSSGNISAGTVRVYGVRNS